MPAHTLHETREAGSSRLREMTHELEGARQEELSKASNIHLLQGGSKRRNRPAEDIPASVPKVIYAGQNKCPVRERRSRR
jgi:hypothetical protein